MSSKAALFLTAAVLLASQAVAQPVPAPAPTLQQEFQELLERVKKSDASVDFGRMRQLQPRLESYKPYGADPEDHPFAALSQGRDEQAKSLAEYILGMNYLDLESHRTAPLVRIAIPGLESSISGMESQTPGWRLLFPGRSLLLAGRRLLARKRSLLSAGRRLLLRPRRLPLGKGDSFRAGGDSFYAEVVFIRRELSLSARKFSQDSQRQAPRVRITSE